MPKFFSNKTYFRMLIGLAWLGSMLSMTSEKFGEVVKHVFDKALNVESSELIESDEDVISDDFSLDEEKKDSRFGISNQISIPKGGDSFMPSPLMRRMTRETRPNFQNGDSEDCLASPAISKQSFARNG